MKKKTALNVNAIKINNQKRNKAKQIKVDGRIIVVVIKVNIFSDFEVDYALQLVIQLNSN